MTTYKRGSTWCYHLNVLIDGKRVQHKRGGFTTRADAQRAERAKLSEVDGGVRLGASQLTLGDYLAQWLVRYERSGAVKSHTVTTAQSLVRVQLTPRLGHVTLARLRRLHVQTLVGDLVASGLSPKTVRNVIGLLHKALGDAVRLGVLPYNCADNVTLPKYVRPDLQPYDAAEVAALLQYVDAHDDLLAAAWWLALTCGLRRGELCGLRWQDVDLVRGELAVRVTRLAGKHGTVTSTPKSRNSVRTLTLVPGAVNALARLRDQHDALRAQLGDWSHDQVLVMHDGAPVKPGRLSKRWHALLRAAGLRELRLHDARHTHGTVLADAGVPVHAISARMGHASVATTMHFYVHAGAAADRRAALTFADLLQSTVGSKLVAELPETDERKRATQQRNDATTPLGERNERETGGDDGTRTHDPLLAKQVL